MKFKLAQKKLEEKIKTVSDKEIIAQIEKDKSRIYYFDKSNAHKDLLKLVEVFEKKEYSVYFNEIKYGLDEDDYMYEMHIL